jgi:hypothetical protein
VGRNGFLSGGKAGEQYMGTQHIQDAGVPTRMPGDVPHGPWCEDGVVVGPGLLQTLTDVVQALVVGEWDQCHAGDSTGLAQS